MNTSPTMAAKHAPDLWGAARGEYYEDPRILEIMQKYFDQPIHCRVIAGHDTCELTLTWGYRMRFSDYTYNRANAKAFLNEVRKVHNYYFPVAGPSINDIKALDFTHVAGMKDSKKGGKDAYEPPKDEFLRSLHAMVETKPFGEVYALMVERIGFDPLDRNDVGRKILEELKITSKNLSSYIIFRLGAFIAFKLNGYLYKDFPGMFYKLEGDGFYLQYVNCETFENIDELFLEKMAHILLDVGFLLVEGFEDLKGEFQKEIRENQI